jgi:pentose-5-phosphate-3-epimerase
VQVASVEIIRAVGPGLPTARSEGWFHLDVRGSAEVAWLRQHRRGLHGPVECHLATGVGADILEELLPLAQRVMVPCEQSSARALLTTVRDDGCQCGVSVNRQTPVEGALRFLSQVDSVLFLNDQRSNTLAHGTIDKLLAVRRARLDGPAPLVMVEGVTGMAASLAVAAGATGLVVSDCAQLKAVRDAVADELKVSADLGHGAESESVSSYTVTLR